MFRKKDIEEIRGNYNKKYFTLPFRDYVNGTTTSTLRHMKEDLGYDVRLGWFESLKDPCLRVGLRKRPLAKVKLPARFKGVQVFYDIVAECE